MSLPKYPHVTVQLLGKDSNVFNLIGLTAGAMRKAKVPPAEITEFTNEAMNKHSYDEVLTHIMETVEVT